MVVEEIPPTPVTRTLTSPATWRGGTPRILWGGTTRRCVPGTPPKVILHVVVKPVPVTVTVFAPPAGPVAPALPITRHTTGRAGTRTPTIRADRIPRAAGPARYDGATTAGNSTVIP